MNNPEQSMPSAERLADVGEASEKAAERLKNRLENSPETTAKNKQERLRGARKETEATFAKESGREKKSGGEPSASSMQAVRKVTKAQKKTAYQKTLQQAQSHMSLPARTFSKLIHTPIVEKTSETIGSTIARPNAILMGGLSSLLLVSSVYLIAKHYGYNLSGGETMVAFGLGWVLGLVIDYARLILSNRS